MLIARTLPLSTLVVAASLLSACGGGGETSTGARVDAGEAAGFPVHLRNQLGPVEVDARPQRVVALDFDSADAAVALGVDPVGMAAEDFGSGPIQPWTQRALGGAEPQLFELSDGIPLEEIAALHPDVILATNSYELGESYEELSQIAPVIGPAGEEGTDSWQTSTRRIGTALGEPAAAERLIAAAEAAVRDAARAHPEFDGQTFSFFNYYEGAAWVITKADASVKFLQQLGFVLSPTVAKLHGVQGRAEVSPERFALLDADLVVGTTPEGDVETALADSPTLRRLGAVRRDAFVGLDLTEAVAIAFPSALSVEWGLEQLTPELAAAVGGPRPG